LKAFAVRRLSRRFESKGALTPIVRLLDDSHGDTACRLTDEAMLLARCEPKSVTGPNPLAGPTVSLDTAAAIDDNQGPTQGMGEPCGPLTGFDRDGRPSTSGWIFPAHAPVSVAPTDQPLCMSMGRRLRNGLHGCCSLY
jgi:hypothetical protein